MSKSLFTQALKRYGQQMDLTEIQYDDEAGTCLKFADDIELHLIWHEHHGCALASVFCGHPPKSNQEELFISMLQANYFWAETGGATLCYASDINAIFLVDKWKINHLESSTKFSKHIDLIVNAATHWKNRITQSSETDWGSSAQPCGAGSSTELGTGTNEKTSNHNTHHISHVYRQIHGLEVQ